MRWGKRQAGESKADRRKANRETLRKAGEERLDTSGGSRGKAISKSVGKSLMVNLVTNVGGSAITSLAGNNPSVRIGVAAVNTIIQGVAIGKTINEIRAVNEASRAREGS
jgi:hypothetical protein